MTWAGKLFPLRSATGTPYGREKIVDKIVCVLVNETELMPDKAEIVANNIFNELPNFFNDLVLAVLEKNKETDTASELPNAVRDVYQARAWRELVDEARNHDG